MQLEVNLYSSEEIKTSFKLWIIQEYPNIRLEYRNLQNVPFIIDSLSSFKTISIENENTIELTGFVTRRIQFKDESDLSNFISSISNMSELVPQDVDHFEIRNKGKITKKTTKKFMPNDSVTFMENANLEFSFIKENNDAFVLNRTIPISIEDIDIIYQKKTSIIPFSGFDFDSKTTFHIFEKCFIPFSIDEMEEKYTTIEKQWQEITKFEWEHDKNLKKFVQNTEDFLSQCNIRSPITKDIIFNALVSCMY